MATCNCGFHESENKLCRATCACVIFGDSQFLPTPQRSRGFLGSLTTEGVPGGGAPSRHGLRRHWAVVGE